MNARVFAFILLPSVAFGQGYADLGRAADGYRLPEPGRVFAFPQDHGPHPGFRIEWWYVTANLETPDGAPLGVQWTLFRSALSPRTEDWETAQVWMGHAGLTTETAHFAAERFSRGGIGTAGVRASPFSAWIDEWEMSGPDINDVRLTASSSDFAYDLELVADGPFVLHGDDGYSVKSEAGQSSHYYSQPAYSVTGTVTLGDGPLEVTGHAWLDREWSSQPLAEDQSGWDWFSLSFESGARFMGYRLRDDAGAYTTATWIAPDGDTTIHGDGAFDAVPLETVAVEGRDVPVRWRVTLPERDLDVTVAAINPAAWMDLSFPYWEGPVTVEGSHAGSGYLEMTGYE